MDDGLEVGYIMKGFPRLSEVFISNEVELLETMGLRLQIFALQSLSEKKVHAQVGAIRAPVHYLPEDSAAAEVPFGDWLRANFTALWRGHGQLLRRRPRAYLTTLWSALQFSVKYRASRWRLKKSFYKDFLRAGHIAAQVLDGKTIGHLHGHFCHGSATITMWASELTGIPFSFTAHAKDIYLPELNPGDLLPRKIRRAKFVATCTDANRQHLQRLCPEVRTIKTIYHGLSTAFFTPEPAPVETPAATILSVGRLVKKKGFPVLIEACRLLRERSYDFRCRIIGAADEDSGVVERLIEKYDLAQRVFLEAPVAQEALRQIYRDCTIFALPCLVAGNGDRDGIPNVLVEAMATAKPVVATAVSGIPELIDHGIDGVLVAPEDPQALAGALEILLQDGGLRARLGRQARAKVCARFDSSKTTVQLRDLFASCLTERLRSAA